MHKVHVQLQTEFKLSCFSNHEGFTTYIPLTTPVENS